MTERIILSKHTLLLRLGALAARRGSRGKNFDYTTLLLVDDVARHLGLDRTTLAAVGRKKREMEEGLQVQLSNFFLLWDRGVFAKVAVEGGYAIKRVPPAAGAQEPPRATIDLTGLAPRINWSR